MRRKIGSKKDISYFAYPCVDILTLAMIRLGCWLGIIDSGSSCSTFCYDVVFMLSVARKTRILGQFGPRTGSIRSEKVCSPLTTKNLAPPIFQISPNSEKRCLHGQNRDFGCSEGDFDRKPAPQESESACIRSARWFPTIPCLRRSRDQFWKTNNWEFRNFHFVSKT